MNESLRRFSHLILLVLSAPVVSQAQEENELFIAAEAPAVEIETRAPGRNFIRLPALEYTFTIDSRCRGDFGPKSFLLSVADTRRSLSEDQIDAEAPTQFTLRIPAGQIGPVALEGFCVGADEQNDRNARREMSSTSMTVPSILSAHASLRCASESDEQVVYVSEPLDVRLVCREPDEPE